MQPALTAAETICSALVRPGLTTLAADGEPEPTQPTLQHPLDTGALAVLLPDDGRWTPRPGEVGALGAAIPEAFPYGSLPLAGRLPRPRMPTGMLEITDHLLLGGDKPIRSVTWLAGYLERMPLPCQRAMAVEIADSRPHEGLLDIGHGASLVLLWPTSAVLADTHGIEVVDTLDLMNAQPDPFSLMQDAWLTHLEDTHADVLARLARRLPPELRGSRVRPLAIDRFGITLRVTGAGGGAPEGDVLTGEGTTTDVRMPFGREVHDPVSLGKAVRALARCPHQASVTYVR